MPHVCGDHLKHRTMVVCAILSTKHLSLKDLAIRKSLSPGASLSQANQPQRRYSCNTKILLQPVLVNTLSRTKILKQISSQHIRLYPEFSWKVNMIGNWSKQTELQTCLLYKTASWLVRLCYPQDTAFWSWRNSVSCSRWRVVHWSSFDHFWISSRRTTVLFFCIQRPTVYHPCKMVTAWWTERLSSL